MVSVKQWGIDRWLGTGQTRINEAEAVNMLVALCTWSGLIQLNAWVDSSAAKGAITNGYSKSRTLTKIAGEIWLKVEQLQCGLWIHQVPTKLNPADPLSRGDDTIARVAEFEQVEASCCAPDKWRF